MKVAPESHAATITLDMEEDCKQKKIYNNTEHESYMMKCHSK